MHSDLKGLLSSVHLSRIMDGWMDFIHAKHDLTNIRRELSTLAGAWFFCAKQKHHVRSCQREQCSVTYVRRNCFLRCHPALAVIKVYVSRGFNIVTFLFSCCGKYLKTPDGRSLFSRTWKSVSRWRKKRVGLFVCMWSFMSMLRLITFTAQRQGRRAACACLCLRVLHVYPCMSPFWQRSLRTVENIQPYTRRAIHNPK